MDNWINWTFLKKFCILLVVLRLWKSNAFKFRLYFIALTVFFIYIDLELGELLHDESFGLFEAMSAIEMMDPKMDAGMLCNRGKKVLNFDQAVQVR